MVGTENPVNRFRAFFDELDSVPSESDANPLQERSLVIDWGQLADFDAALAQQLVNHPDAILGYAREALLTLGATRAPDDGLPQLRIRNLKTATLPGELATVPLGHLVSVSGMLVATTDVRSSLTAITVECQRCGTITKGRYFGLTTPDVRSCRSCGETENQPVPSESDCVDTQYGRLLVPTSTGDTQSETIHLRLDADLQPVSPGTPVTVTGIVRPCQRSDLNRRPTLQTRFIDCLDIVSENRTHKEAPSPTTWTPNDLAAQSTYLASLADAIAPSVSGFWRAKLGLALLYVEPTRPDVQPPQCSPNILLVAPTTAQRRRLLEAFSDLAPIVQYQATAEEDGGPIVTEVEQVASKWWVETGPLVQATGGLALVDGLEAASETQQLFVKQALSGPEIRLAKAGIEVSLDTCDQLVTTVTPPTGPTNSQDAVPLDDDVCEVFDLQLTDGGAGTAARSELVRLWTESIETVSETEDLPPVELDTTVYRSVLTRARLLEHPTIAEAAQQRLQNSQMDYSHLVWVATALARLCGQQYVRPRDVDRAERVAMMLTSSAL